MAAIHDLIAQIGDERLREFLEVNKLETIQKLLLLTQPAQLDVLFDGVR